ncbi:MAG: TlyA family RNA methyltransferase [Oscillospiraceae bacterium]|jgi:23S rRNA (cytidine1920-2'-O)/16S rRNA (cytidine1409-2'-O)-methyltransferase|nr:TlyA family RNA methyltransferase [Oscillospiraceae bacterium]
MAEKIRLDVLLTERGLFESRERSRAAVMSGDVYVNGQREDKPGAGFPADAGIEVRRNAVEYVSRGGLKLAKALDTFGISVLGLRVLDGGASTGGFTDCLLKCGASHVWAVDVGYGQLAWPLRNDERVTCIERFNIRALTSDHLGGLAGMATLDLSFISLSLVLPAVKKVLVQNAPVVCLVKPQFEAGRGKVGKNGVVRDAAVHLDVLQGFSLSAAAAGYGVKGITFSPIKGPKGNIEFLAHLNAGGVESPPAEELESVVRSAHEELT